MTIKLTCPVCGRAEIEGNICPNCETDLTLIRQLQELPQLAVEPAVIAAPKSSQNIQQLLLVMGIIILLLGIALGRFIRGESDVQTASVYPTEVIETARFLPSLNKPKIDKNSPASCGGFYYSVQRGDSLSRIARKFYGEGSRWPQLIETNPNLKGRENQIEVGEVILIQNLPEYCL
ncbi:MAG: LysM domain-containing protein [Limnospira sp. PMC 1291.21]|uniref:LysM domain-containing protein n=3 Tax=Limnospira TaxID=2596745 RepID=A0A9P1KBP1_9CYAN|nr:MULTISPECIES: LysM domain-containing protein [Limnospira]EKD10128.1 peptidoglycan-binding LysM [Arthrospira platensis C1]MDC0838289.1 LysM domain-containing protein [Limnoraphis robusta]MDY7052038.1 LysM domain-containing protein [Limnospira fusiformis LS22]QJB28540.1 LysM peptidoglycan-binding domain-containing protein [Limnospira fusiformis SAG 85.79]EDZ95525.1 Peptidoglycan-binding LysM [Limnospira maxima CS-328]